MANKALVILTVFLLTFTNLQAQTAKQVKQMAYADSSRLVEIFKDIHQNPELGFMEVRTSGIIAKELKSYAGNYLVDISAIPLGTEIGTAALLAAFKESK